MNSYVVEEATEQRLKKCWSSATAASNSVAISNATSVPKYNNYTTASECLTPICQHRQQFSPHLTFMIRVAQQTPRY